jgi:hypothetical protein
MGPKEHSRMHTSTRLVRQNRPFKRLSTSRPAYSQLPERSAISERIVNEDRVLPFRARRQQSDGRLDQFLDAPNIFDRLSRKIGPGSRASRRILPAGYSFVNGFDSRLRRLACRHAVDAATVEVIADADFDLLETVKNVEFGQSDSVDAGGFHGLPDKYGIKPAAAAPAACIDTILMAAIAKQLADIVGEFGRKRTATHAGRIGFRDPQHIAYGFGTEARARRRIGGNRVG